MKWTNSDALHRHACHAYEDFRQLRRDRNNENLWHSMSHHLRHAVHRSSHETGHVRIANVRRAGVSSKHK